MQEWLDQGAFTDSHAQDLVYVSAAYGSLYDDNEMPERLLEGFERAVLENALSLDVQQATHLAGIFAERGSTQLMTLLERIIGSNIDDLSPHEAYNAFLSFSAVGKA